METPPGAWVCSTHVGRGSALAELLGVLQQRRQPAPNGTSQPAKQPAPTSHMWSVSPCDWSINSYNWLSLSKINNLFFLLFFVIDGCKRFLMLVDTAASQGTSQTTKQPASRPCFMKKQCAYYYRKAAFLSLAITGYSHLSVNWSE